MVNPRVVNMIVRFLILVALVAVGVSAIMIVRGIVDKPKVPRTAVERDIMDAEESVTTDPTSVKARVALSLAYSRAGRYGDAADEAQTAVRLDRSNAYAHYALGVAKRRLGDKVGAIKSLNQAIVVKTGLNDVLQQAFVELGEIFMEEKKYKDAVDAYTGALGEGPESTYVVIGLAGALEKSGDIKSALEEYRNVLDYDPDNKEAKFALVRLVLPVAKAFEKSGNKVTAIDKYKSVLEYDPSNKEAKAALARLGVKIK